jgi:hypothetical protein
MARRESPAFRHWLLVGLVLHAVMGVVLHGSRGALRHSVDAPRSTPAELELSLEDGPLASTHAAGSAPRVSAPVGVAPSSASTPPTAAGAIAQRAARESVASVAPHGASAARSAVPGGERLASTTTPSLPAAAGEAFEPSEPAGSSREVSPSESAPPRPLSLDELGVGAFNPFLGDDLTKPGAGVEERGAEGAAAASGRKLEQSIETALARRDQQLGLGPEGPVVAAVETLVMQSTTAPNSEATLFVRTDAEGKVVHTELRVASSDGPEWERIARELARTLGDKRMRVPRGSHGVSFQLKVTSKEQLPSGAAPGLEINVLGATLKRGRGDNATKISILEPKITTQKVPLLHDPLQREVDALVVSLAPFALRGDPVDIGAPARRVVRAHLRDLTVH